MEYWKGSIKEKKGGWFILKLVPEGDNICLKDCVICTFKFRGPYKYSYIKK